jgi:TetR/AcrR family transcriptional regulator, fatty acid metabolism regulator protein
MAKKNSRPPAHRLPRDERISRIVAVTREMLNEVGYENIVTTEVAKRCGISEATIYKCFETKRDLLLRVAEQWFDELLSEEQRSLEGRGAQDALRQVVWRMLSVVRREPALTRFVLIGLRSDATYRSTSIFELNSRFTSQVEEVLTAGVTSGELRDDVPVNVLRNMIFGSIEHQSWSFLLGGRPFSVDKVAEDIVTVIYRAMRRESPVSPVGQPGLEGAVSRLERVSATLEGLVAASLQGRREANDYEKVQAGRLKRRSKPAI